MVRAGIGRRLGALSIDWLASLLVTQLIFGRTFPYGSVESALTTELVFFAEVMFFTGILGGSFGQILVGVRVVRCNGARLSVLRAALRTLLLCLVVPAVIMDSEGRGLHDKAADARAIRVVRRAG